MTLSDSEIETIRQFAEHNPDATVTEVLGRFSCSPADREAIEALLNGEDAPSDETTTEPESDRSRESLTPAEHYRREGVSSVYTTLGECEGVGLAGGVADFTRWYRYERVSDDTEATARGRIMPLSKDWDTLDGALDRTLYASTSYAPAEWLLSSWTPTRGTGKDRVWRDDEGDWGDRAKPTPNYDEIVAQVLLVDIDLPDDLKRARHCDEAFPKETIERALSYTVARFSSLVGNRERVFLLDSAGGIYVLLPPAVTAPIVDEFPDDSGALLDELTDRMNDWLEDIEAETKAEFPDLVREDKDDVLTFDDVNHKNRIYKAPLSLHKSHDAVVHPLDPSDPSYERLPLADVALGDIEEAREWSEAFTADTAGHREGVKSVVSTLFADIEAEADSWTDVLRAWLDDQEEPDQRPDTPLPRPSPDRDPDAGVTAYVQDVKDAVDDLDAKSVGMDTIVSDWKERKDDRSGSGLRSFYPTWDKNCNGNANIMNLSEGVWIDTGEGDKGGPAKMALIDAKNFPRRGGYATGRDWWRGVRLLRERYGYDSIPVYVPPVGSTHSHGQRDRSPLWALCDAAVGLGICRRSDLIEKSSDDGRTYHDLPTPVYNATLDALDEASIEHGRDRRGNGESGKSARATLEEGANEDETETKKFAREVLIDLLSAG
jgi:putative DNA primase/helicase